MSPCIICKSRRNGLINMTHIKHVCRLILALVIAVYSHMAPQAMAGTAADNLAAAVRFPTVSHQDRTKMDVDAFSGLQQFLRATYPRVFDELNIEVINTYSLLITWTGLDTTLNPVLFHRASGRCSGRAWHRGGLDLPRFCRRNRKRYRLWPWHSR